MDTKVMMNEAIKAKLEQAKSTIRKGVKLRQAHAVIENGPDSTDYVVAVFIETMNQYDGASYFQAQGRAAAMQKELGYLGYGYEIIKVEV
ncbi:hypothetical protein ZPAH1_orf00074 [Aeromonas phage ZPAH1]|nr:hypothetical protein ZPAH1_orf00074 [Aeromonas phage ZPAH1]